MCEYQNSVKQKEALVIAIGDFLVLTLLRGFAKLF